MSDIQKWEACGHMVRTVREADGSGGWLVAECSLRFEGATRHAKLFAAAPELLEALHAMLEQFTKTPSTLKDSETRVRAHEAIAKALGGKS